MRLSGHATRVVGGAMTVWRGTAAPSPLPSATTSAAVYGVVSRSLWTRLAAVAAQLNDSVAIAPSKLRLGSWQGTQLWCHGATTLRWTYIRARN